MQAHVDAIIAKIEAHFDAVLLADANAAVPTVYDTDVDPDADYPRVIVIAPNLKRDRTAIGGGSADIDDLFQVKCAGATAAQPRVIAAGVESALDRQDPGVSGWSGKTMRTSAGPVIVDRDITLSGANQSPAALTDTYRYKSTPTA